MPADAATECSDWPIGLRPVELFLGIDGDDEALAEAGLETHVVGWRGQVGDPLPRHVCSVPYARSPISPAARQLFLRLG